MNARQSVALWVGRLSAQLPPGFNQTLWRGLRLAKSQPIHRLTGTTKAGQTGTMILAGNGPIGAYAPSVFFADAPQEEVIATVPALRLADALDALRETADLTVARVDSIMARTLFRPDYLRVPEWVRSCTRVPSVSEKLGHNSGSLKQDLRLVRRHQYKPVESKDEKDLRHFYDTMFRPHTVGRHRSDIYLKSYEEVRTFWRKGCLIWVDAAGERVAGMVVAKRKDTLVFIALGTRQGDETLLRKGVLSAAYQFSFEYAQRHGYERIDFGATRPSLNDGLLRYKRKWGAVLDGRTANPALLLTYWPRTTPSIAAMLESTPLVFKQDGGLCAIVSENAPTLEEQATRGLGCVYVAPGGKPMLPLAAGNPPVTVALHEVLAS